MPLFNNFRQNPRTGTGMMGQASPSYTNSRTGTGIMPQNMNPNMQQHPGIYQQPMTDSRLGTGGMTPPHPTNPPMGMPGQENNIDRPQIGLPAINRNRLFR